MCRCVYTDRHGRPSILVGLKEALWHSISHTLSIDVFQVNAFPSRLVTVAYGFLVMILTNTYTANLAAFLTVEQLDSSINSVTDLRGKAVGTIQPYLRRLEENHGIAATDADSAHRGCCCMYPLRCCLRLQVPSTFVSLPPAALQHESEACRLGLRRDDPQAQGRHVRSRHL